MRRIYGLKREVLEVVVLEQVLLFFEQQFLMVQFLQQGLVFFNEFLVFCHELGIHLSDLLEFLELYFSTSLKYLMLSDSFLILLVLQLHHTVLLLIDREFLF